jgi:multidrug efflux pump subunit AcrA (membrane-fusion protein)
MKLRQIILLIVIISIIGLIYYPIVLNQEEADSEKGKKEEKNYLPIMVALNKSRNLAFISYGQILADQQLDITMEVQGIIERQNRTLKPGETFKKGEFLVKVERTEALYNLLSRRSAFMNLIASIMPDLSVDLPNEKKKWENYLNEINPVQTLPLLPRLNSKKEELLINNRNIPSEFYSLKSLEEQIEKYYYVAPFSGSVVSSSVEPGSMVTPGMRIATIAKIDDYEIKVPINLDQIEYFSAADSIIVTNAAGKFIGNANLIRKSKVINDQTQSIDGFFELYNHSSEDIIQGMYVNLKVETPLFEKAIVLPENSVVDNNVQLLKDSLVQAQPVQVVGSKKDSLFVTGIPDQASVILEPLKAPNDSTKYIGIKRD